MNNHIFIETRHDKGTHLAYDTWDLYFQGKRIMQDLEWFEVTLLQDLLDKSDMQYTEQTQ